MPRTRSSPVKRREKVGSWGGETNDARRRGGASVWDRKEIAQDYFDRMESHRKTRSERRPRREAVIRELMAEFDVTHRMVERCVAEFLPDIRRNSARYA